MASVCGPIWGAHAHLSVTSSNVSLVAFLWRAIDWQRLCGRGLFVGNAQSAVTGEFPDEPDCSDGCAQIAFLDCQTPDIVCASNEPSHGYVEFFVKLATAPLATWVSRLPFDEWHCWSLLLRCTGLSRQNNVIL
jgi:hypothetical protein